MDDYQDKDIINDSAKGDDQDYLLDDEGGARADTGFKSRSARAAGAERAGPGAPGRTDRSRRRVHGDGAQATPRTDGSAA